MLRSLFILCFAFCANLAIAQTAALETNKPVTAPANPPPAAAPAPAFEPKVVVTVDKTSQQIFITTPDLEKPLVDKVSTGGGLKTPNGKERSDAQPYCGTTPTIQNLVVPAIEKGKGQTMEKVHYSKLFEDGNGEQIPMPNAINLFNGTPQRREFAGIFFHTVPPSYTKLLGQNVSGGCIRLSKPTSSFLYSQMKKHGGIIVHIIGEDPPASKNGRNYCTPKMVAAAKAKMGQSGDTDWAYNRPGPRRSNYQDYADYQDALREYRRDVREAARDREREMRDRERELRNRQREDERNRRRRRYVNDPFPIPFGRGW